MLTPDTLFKIKETVVRETRASLATSSLVVRFVGLMGYFTNTCYRFSIRILELCVKQIAFCGVQEFNLSPHRLTCRARNSAVGRRTRSWEATLKGKPRRSANASLRLMRSPYC